MMKHKTVEKIKKNNNYYCFNDNYSESKRNNKLIIYPIQNLRFGDACYDLYAVCVHSGWGTEFGHYYAYVNNYHQNKWYMANDSHVSPISNHKIEEVVTKNATLLMYRKQD